ncbi:unnamed protein product [Rhizoctonia solani]|uniref:Uncharacterized protein n=1 Tax=Rhizoctonia solani TaxID=456999 RepID=A0A8H2WS55_9AGAM|nr:unnamed protein product [Rhizoctonia solani]
MTYSHLPKRTLFPNDRTGEGLANLFIASIIISSTSTGLGLSRAGVSSPFGLQGALITFALLFIIPGIYVPTLIHHITIWYLLGKKGYVNLNHGDFSTEPRFKCLWRKLNLFAMLLLGMIWLAGGILRLLVGIYNVLTNSDPSNYAIEFAAAGLAVIEGVILVAAATLSRKLRREAKIERARIVPEDTRMMQLESESMLAAE